MHRPGTAIGELTSLLALVAAPALAGLLALNEAKTTDLIVNTSTDLIVTQIKYDVRVSDALTHLPKLVDDPTWQSGGTEKGTR